MSREEELAKEISDKLGGIENILTIANCITRLRVNTADIDKVDLESLKKIPGVLGIIEAETLQIVLGPGIVNKVANLMVKMQAEGTLKTDRELAEIKAAQTKEKLKANQNNNSNFKRILKSISNIFVPLIPGFVGAGIIAGISAILTNNITAGNLDPEAWQIYVNVLNVLNRGIFSYLAIYVGINTAKEFGGTAVLGGGIGGITLLPGITADFPISNIFNGNNLAAGQGGIIGVIIAVWLMCLFEKSISKFIPNSVDIIVRPTIVLLIIGLITVFFIMPFAGVISANLVYIINWILDKGGILAGFLLATLFLPMVLFGLHQVLTPIHFEMMQATATDTLPGYTVLLPILAMAGGGQVGAAIAIWLKCYKNKPLINIIKGALPVGILGIGEPLIYGVTVPLGRPFITACLGGGIGGAIIGLNSNSVGAVAIGPSGVALIPLIANNLWSVYVFGLLGAYVGGFLLTYFFGVPKEAQEIVD